MSDTASLGMLPRHRHRQSRGNRIILSRLDDVASKTADTVGAGTCVPAPLPYKRRKDVLHTKCRRPTPQGEDCAMVVSKRCRSAKHGRQRRRTHGGCSLSGQRLGFGQARTGTSMTRRFPVVSTQYGIDAKQIQRSPEHSMPAKTENRQVKISKSKTERQERHDGIG